MRAHRDAGELDRARARLVEAVDLALRDLAQDEESAALQFLADIGEQAYELGELRAAERAQRRVLDVDSRALPADHESLQTARRDLGITLKSLGEFEGAKCLEEQVLESMSRTLPEDDLKLQAARQNLAGTLKAVGDLAGARKLFEQALAVYERTLPPEHPHFQLARLNLAVTLQAAGDFRTARSLFEHVLEFYSRSLPDDHPHVLAARQGLAATLQDLGDTAGALVLRERVLDARARTLPADHPQVQSSRQDVATTLYVLGDLRRARALQESVLEVYSRTLPADHAVLQQARRALATTLDDLGDREGARTLRERAYEISLRTLPADHRDLQAARQSLARTLGDLGDHARARSLYEQVLDTYSRTLPADHPDVEVTRVNLGSTLRHIGELPSARVLGQRALASLSRTLPPEHPYVQHARQSLAMTLDDLGDLGGARALAELSLEARSSTLPADHPHVQAAKLTLAGFMKVLGDLQGARSLEEQALAVYARTFPDDHPNLQAARVNLAATLEALGDPRGARVLEEQALAVLARTRGPDDRDVQMARMNLAATVYRAGDVRGARGVFADVLQVFERTLTETHPDVQLARQNLAASMLDDCSRSIGARGTADWRQDIETLQPRASAVLAARSRVQTALAREIRLTASAREAEERSARLAQFLDFELSAALGYGGLEPMRELVPDAFAYAESTRNSALSSTATAWRASREPSYAEARDRLRGASADLARLVRSGTKAAEYDTARAERESAERALLELGRAFSEGKATSAELDASTVSAALHRGEAAVAYRRYARRDVTWRASATELSAATYTSVDSLCAFVVLPREVTRDSAVPPSTSTSDESAHVRLLDLGPFEPIQAAIVSWRESLGIVDGRGTRVRPTRAPAERVEYASRIRALAFDPLHELLGKATRIVLVLDDALHLVPFDALPTNDDARERLGDVLRFETRATLGERLDGTLQLKDSDEFVGVGGIEYGGSISLASTGSQLSESTDAVPAEIAGILRSSAFEGGFRALKGTSDEVNGLHDAFAMSHANAARSLLVGAGATKAALLAAAPRARWLHVATHGWFAPESIRSWEDDDPIDAKSGLAFRQSSEETVKRMSPMLLCGLALAGANLPEDAVGRAPGLLTADELSTLDLSNCELAVLSACDTARGEMRRAGQGVASLQKALQIAGARSVITSLWKVPDEATKELMLDFYRRLWVEKKPKWQALKEAKRTLRDAKDERGEPKYTVRDWAAWVLTGEPD